MCRPRIFTAGICTSRGFDGALAIAVGIAADTYCVSRGFVSAAVPFVAAFSFAYDCFISPLACFFAPGVDALLFGIFTLSAASLFPLFGRLFALRGVLEPVDALTN
ncbi:hypothetical protein D3C86_1542650 [compost metagenome]